MKYSKKSEGRRSELIAATLKTIGEARSLDITVSQIAGKAGVSSALAHHYFTSKEDLFFATLRHLLSMLRDDVVGRLAAAGTPRGRLSAIVEASFAPAHFNAGTVAAWTLFYVKAQSSARFSRLLGICVRRTRSNLLHELRRIAPDRDAAQLAEIIAALIDGLYLRQGLESTADGRRRCIEATEAQISMLIGSA